jgi:Uma2 family endonuclease
MEAAAEYPRPHRWTSDEYFQMIALGLFRDQKVELIGGEVLVHPGLDAEPPGPEKLPARRWTREEFFQMLDLGWFQGQRVTLIDGEVLEMPAQKDYHGAAITLTMDALRIAFGPGFWVRNQMSLDLSPRSVPDPDLAVVPGSPRGITASSATPTSALLIVEVAETTLSYDRNHQANLYAAAGIADYWIVNLVQRQLEVYRDPIADSSQLFGFRYNRRAILDPPDTVSPLAAPQASITVADLLP